jgi:glutathione peroxidase
VAQTAVSAYDFHATAIDGAPVPLDRYRGQVMLIVNVASRCGFTPQYRGLEDLYRRHRDRGFVVLGFPCDQFGHQEPGTESEIGGFCRETYDVTFPLFSKIEVNGAGTHPLYRFLKSRRRGWLGSESVKWNFTKFLVGRDGDVIARYGSRREPAAIDAAIERALAQPAAAPPASAPQRPEPITR